MTRVSPPRTHPHRALRPFQIGLSAVCASALTACASAPAPAPQHAATPRQGIEQNTSGARAVDWSKRGEPAELARIIAELTRVTRDDPSDHGSWLALAEAHCLMADGIAALGWKDQGDVAAHLAAAENAALSAAALADRTAAEQLRARELAKLDVVSEERGAALYWFARSAYARAALEGYEALLLDHAVLLNAVGLAVSGAPNIDRGGPLRLMASLLAHPADPSLRDLDAAKQHLERALSIDPKSPANLVAYVEHFAVPAQDGAAAAEKLQQLAALRASTPEEAIGLARAEQLASTIESRLE